MIIIIFILKIYNQQIVSDKSVKIRQSEFVQCFVCSSRTLQNLPFRIKIYKYPSSDNSIFIIIGAPDEETTSVVAIN